VTPEQAENVFANFVEHVERGLERWPGKARVKKPMVVKKFGKIVRDSSGSYRILTMVTLYDGHNHGMRVQMYGPERFKISGWDHGHQRGYSHIMYSIAGDLEYRHLEEIAWNVAIPMSMED
jgi:hypothetical protein